MNVLWQMKEFKEPGQFHTAPLGPPLDSNDHPQNRSCDSEGNFVSIINDFRLLSDGATI